MVPAEELLPRAKAMGDAIAKAGSLAVAYAKDAIANGLNMVKEDGLRYEASLARVLFSSCDQKEGMGAFADKRKPRFIGK